MNKITYNCIFAIGVMIMLTGSILLSYGIGKNVESYAKGDTKTIVSCYDKYGSKIIGATCENYQSYEGVNEIMAGIFVFVMGIFVLKITQNLRTKDE